MICFGSLTSHLKDWLYTLNFVEAANLKKTAITIIFALTILTTAENQFKKFLKCTKKIKFHFYLFFCSSLPLTKLSKLLNISRLSKFMLVVMNFIDISWQLYFSFLAMNKWSIFRSNTNRLERDGKMIAARKYCV